MNAQLQVNVRERLEKVSQLHHNLEVLQGKVAESQELYQEALVPLVENIMHLVPKRSELLVEARFCRMAEILTYLLKPSVEEEKKDWSVKIGSYANFGFEGWSDLREAIEELKIAWRDIFIVQTKPAKHQGIEVTLSLNLP